MTADADIVEWETPFLNPPTASPGVRRALIIFNQPFSLPLLETLWNACSWRCCADGGANRLYDFLGEATVADAELLRNQSPKDVNCGLIEDI